MFIQAIKHRQHTKQGVQSWIHID